MKESRWVGKMRGQVPRYSLNLEGAGEGDLYDDLLSATQAFMVLPREYSSKHAAGGIIKGQSNLYYLN